MKPNEEQRAVQPEPVEIKEEEREQVIKQEEAIQQFYKGRMNLELFISCQLRVLPSDELVEQISKSVVRTSSNTSFEALQQLVCKKLNLKLKYQPYVKLWIQDQDKYVQLNLKDTLNKINENHWRKFDEIQLYNVADFYNTIVKKKRIPQGEDRIVYYSFDFDSIV